MSESLTVRFSDEGLSLFRDLLICGDKYDSRQALRVYAAANTLTRGFLPITPPVVRQAFRAMGVQEPVLPHVVFHGK